MGQTSHAGHFGQQEGDQSKESYCQAKAPDVSSQSAITREKELLRAQHLPALTPWSFCREPSASRLSPRLHRINPLGSPAERCCVHAICGVTRGAPDVQLRPHRVASCCLPFLRGSIGKRVPFRDQSACANGGNSRYGSEVCNPAGKTASCKIYSCSAPCAVPTAAACQGQWWPWPLGSHQPSSSRTPPGCLPLQPLAVLSS